ncbi:MAG: ComF family protein [Oscillospiraceae bacterium]
MRALYRLLDLLFPPKCVLCGRLLEREETDLCGACRREGPVFSGGGMSIPFVTAWMAVYRYEGLARDSLLRFKFGGRQSYAAAYGRLLAARIQGS